MLRWMTCFPWSCVDAFKHSNMPSWSLFFPPHLASLIQVCGWRQSVSSPWQQKGAVLLQMTATADVCCGWWGGDANWSQPMWPIEGSVLGSKPHLFPHKFPFSLTTMWPVRWSTWWLESDSAVKCFCLIWLPLNSYTSRCQWMCTVYSFWRFFL